MKNNAKNYKHNMLVHLSIRTYGCGCKDDSSLLLRIVFLDHFPINGFIEEIQEERFVSNSHKTFTFLLHRNII